MALFSSHRERRLWLCLLLVLVAIYSTLGLAGTLAGFLTDRNLLTPVFFLCMFLVGATVLTQGLKRRPGGIEIAVLLGIVSVYLLMLARMAIPDAHRGHLIEYSVVAVFIYEALMERASQGRKVPLPALITILATTLLGVLDEVVQIFIPNRVFDPLDILFNFLAGLMAVIVCVILAWVRQRFGKPHSG